MAITVTEQNKALLDKGYERGVADGRALAADAVRIYLASRRDIAAHVVREAMLAAEGHVHTWPDKWDYSTSQSGVMECLGGCGSRIYD